MTEGKTPAQIYSLVFGATLLIIGVLGFAVESSFDTGDQLRADELIIFAVNGWHNLVHIASGVLGLMLAREAASARMFALGFGVVYLAVAIWGFADSTILGLIPVNDEDNILHLLIAGAGIAAGLASSDTRRTTTPSTV